MGIARPPAIPWCGGECDICGMPGLRLDFPDNIAGLSGVNFCARCDGPLHAHAWPDDLIANYRQRWEERRR